MLRNLRLEKIIELVELKGYVSLHELMEATESSESTIRADLVSLEKEEKIIRLHGGAKSKHPKKVFTELNMNEKYQINVSEKISIAKLAASLIGDGMIVYIDAGTTTSYICDYVNAQNVVFVTNSMTIAQKLTQRQFKAYVTGGEMKLSTDAFIGSFTQEIINKFTFDLGFFGANGISLNQGFTTPDYEEASVKHNALLRSKEVYVLADNSKFNKETCVKFADLNEATIITDKIVDEAYKQGKIIEVK